MRRRVAHLAEILERGHDAASEVFLPEPIDDHARGHRILRRRDPLRERQPAAGRAAVGTRNFSRRVAVRDDVDEARRHLRSVAFHVAANEEIGRRHLVAPGTLMQVRAGARHRDAALGTADGVVAFAERRRSVVAVRGNLRHRQRFGPLCRQRGNLRGQRFLLGRCPPRSGRDRPRRWTRWRPSAPEWRAASRQVSARFRAWPEPARRCRETWP